MLQSISKQEFTKYLIENKRYSADRALVATNFEFDSAKLTH